MHLPPIAHLPEVGGPLPPVIGSVSVRGGHLPPVGGPLPPVIGSIGTMGGLLPPMAGPLPANVELLSTMVAPLATNSEYIPMEVDPISTSVGPLSTSIGFSNTGSAIAHKEPQRTRVKRSKKVQPEPRKGTRSSARVKARIGQEPAADGFNQFSSDSVPLTQFGFEPEAEESDENWLIKF